MVDDAGDFLGVSSQRGDHLFRGVLKHHCSLIGSSGEGPRGVPRHVQAEDPWHARTVKPLDTGRERKVTIPNTFSVDKRLFGNTHEGKNEIHNLAPNTCSVEKKLRGSSFQQYKIS